MAQIVYTDEDREFLDAVLKEYDPETHPFIGPFLQKTKCPPTVLECMRRQLRAILELGLALQGIAGDFEKRRVGWLDHSKIDVDEIVTQLQVRGVDDYVKWVYEFFPANADNPVVDAFQDLMNAAEIRGIGFPDDAALYFENSKTGRMSPPIVPTPAAVFPWQK